jgi:hypothetical protein
LAQDNESESSKTHDEYFFDLDVVKDEHVFDIDAVKFERSNLLKPEFHGNISFGASFGEGLDESEKGTSNVFNQTEVTLWFGVQLLKDLSFVSELEIEDGFDVYEIERFELNWNIFNEKCALRIGKFYYPFGIERLVENAVNNKLIDRPNPSIKIIPGTWSDEGLELYGDVPFLYKTRLKYEFAVTNGLDERGEQQLDDNNDDKFLGGRLGLEILPDLEIGGSYSTGKYDDDEKYRMDFIGVDSFFRKGGFEIRGEYIWSNVEQPTVDGGSFNRKGYYLQTSYKFSPDINYMKYLEFVGRFDSVDPNDLVRDEGDADRIAFGINYSPNNHVILKLQYEMEDEATESKENKGFIQLNIRW